ncbi:MAG TPA: hypothetical protein VK845_14830 [Gemmatimonadales bacterium]|nr:hypothetical protein [Gemmatimonadales bacterium]
MKPALAKESIHLFDAIAGIVLRCFLFLVVAQLVVWAAFWLAGDPIYRLYAAMIDVPRPEYDQLVLSSMLLLKVLNVVLFLTPFIAIKLMLRGRLEG